MDPVTGRRDPAFRAPISGAGAALAVLGDVVYATDTLSGRLSAFDVRSGARSRRFRANLPGPVTALAASPRRLYVGLAAIANPPGGRVPAVAALDPATGRTDPNFATALSATDPDGAVRALALGFGAVYVSGNLAFGTKHPPGILSLDPLTGRRHAGFHASILASALALAHNRLYATTAGDGQRLVALDPNRGRPHTVLNGIAGQICTLTPAARRLYLSGAFDSIGGQPRANFAGLSLPALY